MIKKNSKRKCESILKLNQQTLVCKDLNKLSLSDQQKIAKNVLIELGSKQHKNQSVLLNSWVNLDSIHLNNSNNSKQLGYKYHIPNRVTKSTLSSRNNSGNVESQDRWDTNMIPKLKLILKKLQSPQKKPMKNEDENTHQFIESLYQRRRKSLKVQELIKFRESHTGSRILTQKMLRERVKTPKLFSRETAYLLDQNNTCLNKTQKKGHLTLKHLLQ